MTSITLAIRASGARCASCNAPAEAWLCSACAHCGIYWRARFNDDARSTTPTSVGRRNLYPGPVNGYAGIPVLAALDTSERLARIRKRVEVRLDLTLGQRLDLLSELKDEAAEYAMLSRAVDARASKYKAEPPLNHVEPLDPRRWCDECLGARTHRRECPLIEIDGAFVGGYPDDGLQRSAATSFAPLRVPNKTWTQHQHAEHRRAIARRWDAFLLQWAKVGLECLSRAVTRSVPPRQQPEAPSGHFTPHRPRASVYGVNMMPKQDDKETARQKLGSVIRFYRDERHLNRAETADRCGTTAGTVEAWERGRAVPDNRTWARLKNMVAGGLAGYEHLLQRARAEEEAERAAQAARVTGDALTQRPFAAALSKTAEAQPAPEPFEADGGARAAARRRRSPRSRETLVGENYDLSKAYIATQRLPAGWRSAAAIAERSRYARELLKAGRLAWRPSTWCASSSPSASGCRST